MKQPTRPRCRPPSRTTPSSRLCYRPERRCSPPSRPDTPGRAARLRRAQAYALPRLGAGPPCECGDRTILVVGDTKRDAADNATAAIWGDRRARIPGTRWDATRLPVPPGLRTPHAREADGGCEWCKEQRGGLHIPSFRGQNDFYRAFDWAAPHQAG
jgi:hypothetical protein